MTINFCPIVKVEAPVERVWEFLSEPANYALWWDAQTRSINPEGPAQAGQKIHAKTKTAGMQFDVNLLIEGVDASKHQIHLKTSLPFGITVFNHITCTRIDERSCQVTFG